MLGKKEVEIALTNTGKKKMVSYTERYDHLKEPMREIAEEHPDYGYPRMTPELQERGFDVGEEVVRKLMKLLASI